MLETVFEQSSDLRTKESALYAIANSDVTESAGFLKNVALKHEDEKLGRTAVYALGNLLEEDKSKTSVMLEVLRNTKHSSVKEGALRMIMDDKSGSSVKVVADMLNTESDLDTRRMAVRVLGGSESDEAVPVLLKIAKDDSNLATRKEAVRALGRIGTPKAQDAIVQLLNLE